MQSQDRDAVALSARTLGGRCSLSPGSEQAVWLPPCATALQSQWPWPVTNGLAAQFALEDDEPLADAWQRLFIGPWALPAPPWGPSGWIKKACCLATLRWRCARMRANGIGLSEQRAEPEDHFGTLLLLAAWLVNPVRMRHLTSFWPGIFSPWSGRFLSVFIAGAGNPFYQALGQLAQKRWRDGRRGCPARSG